MLAPCVLRLSRLQWRRIIDGYTSPSLHPSSGEMYIQHSPANAQRADWISICWAVVCRSRVDVEHQKRETQFSAIKRARKLSTSSTWVYFSGKLSLPCCQSPSEDQVDNWTGKRTTKNVNRSTPASAALLWWFDRTLESIWETAETGFVFRWVAIPEFSTGDTLDKWRLQNNANEPLAMECAMTMCGP